MTFRVRGSRGDKRFPMTSSELERYVADRVLPEDGSVEVELEAPMLELGIDVRAEHAFVFAERLPGPGGLPVGTLGRTLCLISGGIDSPVAAWMTMKRGCRGGLRHVPLRARTSASPRSARSSDLVRVLAR